MTVTGFTMMIGVCLLGFGLDLTHSAHGDTICSGDSELEPGQILQDVLTTCFPKAPYIPNDVDICSGATINCNALRQVFEVIPSCNYCSRSGIDDKLCFYSQLNATRCSVKHFTKSFHCVKHNGGFCHQCDVQFSGGTQQTTVRNDLQTTTTEAADANSGGISDAYKGRKCHACDPCNCEQTEEDDTGVSVGIAVGLFFFGLILGTVVTIVICVCAPSLHSKSSILRGKMNEKIGRHSLHEEKSTSQQTLDQVATNVSPQMEASTHVIPSAPPGTGSFQAGYHTLDLTDNARDSHMYTGLQPNIYQEPMGEGETYEEPDSQPIRGKNTVASPVYQELPDNIIHNTGFNDKHNKALNENPNNVHRNPGGGAEDPENQRPQLDHHYFTLEEQNNQPDNVTQTTDTPYHDYFVLEKEQT